MPDLREWWADLRRRKPIQTWWSDMRRRRPIAEFVGELADRDQDAQGSVLGSAVALRIFLFLVPAALVIVSLVHVIDFESLFDGDELEKGYTTKDIATSLEDTSRLDALWLLIAGLFLAAWAGRSLAKTLAASSVAAWRLPSSQAKVTVVGALALTGIVFLEVIASTIVAAIRDLGGAPAWAFSWGTLVAIVGVTWFLVLLTLPRGVTDPGALLPGALLLGVVQGSIQGVLHAYTEGRVARTVDTYGDLAVTLAILGNLFILGRLMTASFTFTAVTYERFGSLSHLIFGLPGVRRLPRRYQWLADFFSLDVESPAREPSDAERRRRRGRRLGPLTDGVQPTGSWGASGVASLTSDPSADSSSRRGAHAAQPARPSSARVTSIENHEKPVSVMTSSAIATATSTVVSRCSSRTPRVPPAALAPPRRRALARSLPRRKATSARTAATSRPTPTSRSSPSVSDVTISSSAARPPGFVARLGASSTTVRTRTRPSARAATTLSSRAMVARRRLVATAMLPPSARSVRAMSSDDRTAEQGESVLRTRHRRLAVRHVLAAVHHQLAEVVGQVAVEGGLELGDLLLGVAVGGERRAGRHW